MLSAGWYKAAAERGCSVKSLTGDGDSAARPSESSLWISHFCFYLLRDFISISSGYTTIGVANVDVDLKRLPRL